MWYHCYENEETVSRSQDKSNKPSLHSDEKVIYYVHILSQMYEKVSEGISSLKKQNVNQIIGMEIASQTEWISNIDNI